MSHYTSHKKPNYHELDLTVTIRYHGLKATQYFSKFNDQSLKVLRQDLIALKIPHPKTENILLLSHGCVEFSWFRVEQHKSQVLLNNLYSKLRPSNPEAKQAFQETLNELSITSATFREIPGSPISHNAKKRPNPSYTTNAEPPHKKVAVGQAQPGVAAAEQFLNDTLKTLKTEPVEVSLSSLSSKPQPLPKQTVPFSYPPPHSNLSTSPAAWPPSRTYGPSELIEQARAPYVPKQKSFAPPPSSIPQRPTNSDLLQRPAAGPERMANGISTLQGLLKELDELQSRISSSLARESVVVAEITKLRPDYNPPEPPYASLADLAKLKAQLDVSKYELGVAKRELELTNLGLGEAKRELDKANRELGATKHELATERKLRQDAQNALDDIRREAKEPFIIPGLLDAFLSVSSLADKIH